MPLDVEFFLQRRVLQILVFFSTLEFVWFFEPCFYTALELPQFPYYCLL